MPGWQAAEERQSAELAGLELMLQALEAGLEGHKLQVGWPVHVRQLC